MEFVVIRFEHITQYTFSSPSSKVFIDIKLIVIVLFEQYE